MQDIRGWPESVIVETIRRLSRTYNPHPESAMTRLTLHTAESAPAASRPLVERAIQNNGFLPNLIGILANSPLALETYLTVGSINARATLTLAEREVVQITAARVHGCDFCVAGHSAVGVRKAGLPVEQVIALQHGQPTGNTRLDAVLNFSLAVIAHRGAVSDIELQAFLDSGFTQEQALEVVLGVSLATLPVQLRQ